MGPHEQRRILGLLGHVQKLIGQYPGRLVVGAGEIIIESPYRQQVDA